MAKRPWVTTKDVRDYSDYESVQSRSGDKINTDIARAEQYVISYTKNTFDDDTKYPNIPEQVKTAVILIAEMYGNAAVEGKSGYKSETFDDYSYTLADTSSRLINLNLGSLLDEFVLSEPKNTVTMKLRKL